MSSSHILLLLWGCGCTILIIINWRLLMRSPIDTQYRRLWTLVLGSLCIICTFLCLVFPDHYHPHVVGQSALFICCRASFGDYNEDASTTNGLLMMD